MQNKPSILFVENDEGNQKVVQAMLKCLGYVPDLITEALEALETIESRHYDIILVDIMRHKVDAVELTKTIRGRWPPDEQPYIIAIYSLGQIYNMKFCISAGFDDYLCMPFSKQELRAAISRSQTGYEWHPDIIQLDQRELSHQH